MFKKIPFPTRLCGRWTAPCLSLFLFVWPLLLTAAPLLEFRVPPAFPIGNSPQQIVSGDFDGDGIADIASANFGDSTVGVLLGLGGGAYAPVHQYDVGAFPDSIAVGDVNSDGLQDLVTANGNGWNKPGTLSVLLGSSNGTFIVQSNVTVDRGPRGIVIADFNGDGRPDLATAISGGWFATNKVNIAFGNGNGTFGAISNYDVGIEPKWIATEDFDRDGRPDIAAVTYGGTANVLLNRGAGTFTAATSYSVGTYSLFITAGDLNGDGASDVVVCNGASAPATVLFGRGDGTFNTATNLGIEAGQIAITDLNHDGHPDLAAISGRVLVLLGNGTRSFSPPTSYEIGSANMALAAGNFIGDTNIDLAVAGWYAHDVRLLTGVGDGTFSGGTPTIDGYGALWTADLNNDGQLDFMTYDTDASRLKVVLQQTNDTFGPGTPYPTGGQVHAARIGDFNNDGLPDIVVAHYQGSISVLTNEPSAPGTFGNDPSNSVFNSFEISGIHEDIGVGYFDGDTNLDVVVPCYYQASLQVALGDGAGSFRTNLPSPAALPSFPVSVTVADFNGDGKSDAAVADSSSTISAVPGHGDGTFGPSIGFAVPDTTHHVRSADLNCDGKPDLIVALDDSAYVAVLLNTSSNGVINFAPAMAHRVANEPSTVAIADFNGDNIPDIATGNSGSVSVLVGNGDGTFLDATNYFGGGGYILAGDFNGDSMPDLAMGVSSGVGLFWNETLPRLQIQKVPSGVRIAWPAWKPFRIQINDGVQNLPLWTTPSNTPALIGNQFVLTNSAPPSAQFYKLRRD